MAVTADMTEPRKSVTLTGGIIDRIDALAEREHRPFANAVVVLLLEALAERSRREQETDHEGRPGAA